MRITHLDEERPIRAHFEDHPTHPEIIVRTMGFGTRMAMSLDRAIELRTQLDMALEQAVRARAQRIIA
jgi:hypothetical protein